MTIREAIIDDADIIWPIFQKIVTKGDTFAFAPETSKQEFIRLWFQEGMKVFVVEDDSNITGSYFIKQNQPGLGGHIANCGYMVHPDSRGQGIGNFMCQHSLQIAKQLGYRGMQFNLVVSTNIKAVELWQRAGFRIIGTTPGGFKHLTLGYVDTYIMFKEIG